MDHLPFDVRCELEGWNLLWAHLETQSSGSQELARRGREIAERVRKDFELETLSTHPPLAALRRLFRAAGCDPTRYRPSSEALLRRLIKGEELPTILPLVDLNNCLSAALAVPCCVMDETKVTPPFVFRPGKPSERYESLRGSLDLEGKPLLVDAKGPCDTPISGNQRVKVTQETNRAWLVAYLPTGVVEPEGAEHLLQAMLGDAPVAKLLLTAAI